MLVIILLFASCEKSEESQPTFILNGEYSGTFSRNNSETGYNCTSEVTLTLTDSSFSGTSEVHYFPAICVGNIEIEDSKIIFQNTCVWPAHFDWSLILSGEWNYEGNGNHLKLWKIRGNIEDEYSVIKL